MSDNGAKESSAECVFFPPIQQSPPTLYCACACAHGCRNMSNQFTPHFIVLKMTKPRLLSIPTPYSRMPEKLLFFSHLLFRFNSKCDTRVYKMCLAGGFHAVIMGTKKKRGNHKSLQPLVSLFSTVQCMHNIIKSLHIKLLILKPQIQTVEANSAGG